MLFGLPDTCAEASRISPLDDQGGKASVFIEKERRQTQPKLGGFSSKPAGLALFYRNYLPVRVGTTKPSAGADGYNFLGKQNGTGEFQLPKCIFLISKSWFCYLRGDTAGVPMSTKLMRELESDPTNLTVGLLMHKIEPLTFDNL